MKVVSGFFFLLFFVAFIIVGTIKFEILNKTFVFSSLEKNNVYQNLPNQLAKAVLNDPNITFEERLLYSNMISLAKPNLVKNLLERNISGVIDFINGNSKEFVISASGKDLGIKGADINWSLNRNATPEMASIFQAINGLGNILLIVCFVLIVLLILFSIPAGKVVLLLGGGIVIALGGAGKIFLLVVSANTPMKEPSQVLLILLSNSLLSDIATSWLIIGIVLIITWFILNFFLKSKKS